jgi:hydroxymethylpyrimidine pyrophosphatase-like HAD family hydrolase
MKQHINRLMGTVRAGLPSARFVLRTWISMRYLALAADYDGTLASGGVVAPRVVHALERLKASGRKLLLVTGREMDELVEIFPRLDLFDRVVAENGAVLYRPQDGSETDLAARPPEEFLDELRRRNVSPLTMGRVIISSSADEAPRVADAIRRSGLDLEIIFNKNSVMILPRGVDKATGLRAALDELKLTLDELVAVGDGENDIPMIQIAGCGVAVAGALELVKRAADIVLSADAGEGVMELVDLILRERVITLAETS